MKKIIFLCLTIFICLGIASCTKYEDILPNESDYASWDGNFIYKGNYKSRTNGENEKVLIEYVEYDGHKYYVDLANYGYLNYNNEIYFSFSTSSKKDNKVDIHGIYSKKTTDGDGMQFTDAFDILKKDGVKTKKGIFKIGQPMRIMNALALKFAIVANGPCVGALPVYNSTGVDEFWNPKNGNLEGYHAISIVGYNEKGFIIRNSWGGSYGKDGYAFLPNEHMNLFLEIWTITK